MTSTSSDSEHAKRVSYYEQVVLHFEDGSHPDVAIVVNRQDAERLRAGDVDFINKVKSQIKAAEQTEKQSSSHGEKAATEKQRCVPLMEETALTAEKQSSEDATASDAGPDINRSHLLYNVGNRMAVDFIVESSIVSKENKALAAQWSHPEVMGLLSAYEERKEGFNNPTVRKCEVWDQVSRDLSLMGLQKSATLCEKKWSNLKIRYRSIKDSMNKSGAGRSTWTYFERIDNILHNDKATEPAATSSSYDPDETPKRKSIDANTEETKKKKRTSKMPEWFESYLKEEKEDRQKEREEMKRFRDEILKSQQEKNNILSKFTEMISKSFK